MDPCRDIHGHREVFEKRLTLADLADTWLDLGLEQVRVLGSGVAALKGRPSQKNRKFLDTWIKHGMVSQHYNSPIYVES